MTPPLTKRRKRRFQAVGLAVLRTYNAKMPPGVTA